MGNLAGDSAISTIPAGSGENTAGGDGTQLVKEKEVLEAQANGNEGVRGESDTFHAMVGFVYSGMPGLFGHADGVGSRVAGESRNVRVVHDKLVIFGQI